MAGFYALKLTGDLVPRGVLMSGSLSANKRNDVASQPTAAAFPITPCIPAIPLHIARIECDATNKPTRDAMTRTGLGQLRLDRHGRTARSTDFTICLALGSVHPLALRRLNSRLQKPIVNGLRNSDNPTKSLRKLRKLSTGRSAHGRNSEAKYTPPHCKFRRIADTDSSARRTAFR